MTALATSSATTSAFTGMRSAQKIKANFWDGLIEKNRESNPVLASLLEKRRRTRLTIGEINAMGREGVKAGLDPLDEADDRSPLVKFLDVIDLPRNVVVGAMFGDVGGGQRAASVGFGAGLGATIGSGAGPVGAGIGALVGGGISIASQIFGQSTVDEDESRQLVSGRTGTFGLPVVYMSEVLDKLGMEAGVSRAVLGFVGDVAFDPLTYLTGGGNVVRWGFKGGSQIAISKPASKILDDYLKQWSRTGVRPSGGAFDQIHDLVDSTMRVGDRLYDIGAGPKQLDGILEKINKGGLLARQERNILRQHVRGMVAKGTFLDPTTATRAAGVGLSDELVEAAGDFARLADTSQAYVKRFGAVSSRQFTIPLAGFMANRMRHATGGASWDIPIGRLGRPGSLHRKLNDPDLAGRVLKSNAELALTHQLDRAAILRGRYLVGSKDALNSLPDELRGVIGLADEDDLVRVSLEALTPIEREMLFNHGFDYRDTLENLLNPTDLQLQEADRLAVEMGRLSNADRAASLQAADQNVRQLETLIAEGNEKLLGLDPADLEVSSQRRLVETELLENEHLFNDAVELQQTVLTPQASVYLEGAENQMRRFAKDDATMLLAGPAGVMRRLWTGSKKHDDLIDRRAATTREGKVMRRELEVKRDSAQRQLDALDPNPIEGGANTPTATKLARKLEKLNEEMEAIDFQNPPSGLPDVILGAAQPIHKFKNKRGSVRLAFQDDIDEALYYATTNIKGTDRAERTVAAARKKEAMEWLTRNVGLSRETLRKNYGKQLEAQIEKLAAGEGIVDRTTLAASRRVGVDDVTRQKMREHIIRQQDAVDSAIDAEVGLRNTVFETRDELARVIKENTAEVTKLNDDLTQLTGTAYSRLMVGAGKIQESASTALAFGRDAGRDFTRKFARDREATAELAARQQLNEWAPRMRDLRNEVGDKADMAVRLRMAEKVMEADRTVVGFGPDDMNDIRQALAGDEASAKLLNNPKVESLADDFIRDLSKFKVEAQKLGLLGDIDPTVFYLPGDFSDKAQVLVRQMEARAGERLAQDVASGLTSPETYTFHKSTHRMFYHDPLPDNAGNIRPAILPTGENAWIFSGKIPELAPGKIESHKFEKWRQGHLEDHPELRLDGDLFDRFGAGSGAKLGPRWFPQKYASSPDFLNANAPKFFREVGQQVGNELFNEDLLQVMHRRALQHHRALASRTFVDSVLKVARAIDPHEAKSLARAGRDPNVITRIEDGQRVQYRRIKPDIIKNSQIEDLIPKMDGQLEWYYPVPLATAIEDYAKAFKDSKSVGAAMRALDHVHAFWKKTQLLHPSWMTINIVGGAFNAMAIAGSKPQNWLPNMRHAIPMAMKMHMGGGTHTFSKTKMLTFGNETQSEFQWAIDASRRGVLGVGRVALEILNNSHTGQKSTEILKKRGMFAKGIGAWFGANAAADEAWRLTVWFEKMNDGHGIDEAAELAVKALFDYSDLTAFEQRIGTRVWPFYRWMKNNVAAQVHLFIDKPMYHAAFPKLKASIEDQYSSEDLIPEELRPRWMKDNVAVQISKGPEAQMLLLSMFTPAQELFEVGQIMFGQEGFMETMRYAMSSTNPLMKAPLELAVQKEIFTGREIGDTDLGADISMAEYLAMQLRPFREVKRISTRTDLSPAQDILLRGIIGGRLQTLDKEGAERRKSFETGETVRQLRRTIKRALDDDNEDEARRVSVRLLGVYQQMWDLGFTDAVPKALRQSMIQEDMSDPDRFADRLKQRFINN